MIFIYIRSLWSNRIRHLNTPPNTLVPTVMVVRKVVVNYVNEHAKHIFMKNIVEI